ncbi:MAG TPA: recombinase family protein [Lachnospiraceae bacterium]|nr:recombinase family protein [Lachnospiraceae bacterium]
MQSNNGKAKDVEYNVGIYCRLSNEDKDSHYCESDSIVNQKQLLIKYVHENGWRYLKVYVDDGYSGLNFERPGFKQMIEDINKGIINMVITKDMSRLGRDYIDVGYYIEKFFPENNIRYIALNDSIDSEKEWANNDIAPFRAVLNDMYSRDISRKVRSVFYLKRREGKFIGAFAAYGYIKSEIDRNKLLVDENTAGVVKDIFDKYLQGSTISEIANYLNRNGVDSPARYNMKRYGTYNNPKARHFKWSYGTIRAILRNPVYTGTVVQNKYKKLNYKSKKLVAVSHEKWISIKGTHRAIVSEEKFIRVQDILSSSNRGRNVDMQKTRLLKNLIYCGDCGSKMTYSKGRNGVKYVICSFYKAYGKAQCTRHAMGENDLLEMIMEDISEVLLTCADRLGLSCKFKILLDILEGDIRRSDMVKSMLNKLLRKVEIFEDGDIKIYYNFGKP